MGCQNFIVLGLTIFALITNAVALSMSPPGLQLERASVQNGNPDGPTDSLRVEHATLRGPDGEERTMEWVDKLASYFKAIGKWLKEKLRFKFGAKTSGWSGVKSNPSQSAFAGKPPNPFTAARGATESMAGPLTPSYIYKVPPLDLRSEDFAPLSILLRHYKHDMLSWVKLYPVTFLPAFIKICEVMVSSGKTASELFSLILPFLILEDEIPRWIPILKTLAKGDETAKAAALRLQSVLTEHMFITKWSKQSVIDEFIGEEGGTLEPFQVEAINWFAKQERKAKAHGL